MSHASLAACPFAPGHLLPCPAKMRAALRSAAGAACGALQAIGFAGVLWLMVAGPGFLADRDNAAGPARAHTIVARR